MCPVGVHWAVLGPWVGMGLLQWGAVGDALDQGRDWQELGCNQVGCLRGPWEGSTATGWLQKGGRLRGRSSCQVVNWLRLRQPDEYA